MYKIHGKQNENISPVNYYVNLINIQNKKHENSFFFILNELEFYKKNEIFRKITRDINVDI